MRHHQWLMATAVLLAVCTWGEVSASIVRGCVLLDTDCDGEAGTTGFPEQVEVQLKDSGGAIVQTTLSQAGGIGLYEFSGVTAGDYQIDVVVPADYSLGSTTCEDGSLSRCNGGDGPILITVFEDPSQEERILLKANFLLCPPPTGACCLPDFTCVEDVTEADCVARGGDYGGDGSSCDDVECEEEEPQLCWMTGGGVKFEEAVGGFLARVGPRDSVGGNVYPSCSPFPGNGGNWNHPAHSLGMHLLGRDITVIRCGNVDGIEPGTESPVCDVNFIEFEGTGRLQALGRADVERREVCFFGRVEDHNEPGNARANDDPLEVDRYFLRVYECDTGALVFLVDENGEDNDGEVDPLAITGGNFQIHCTSCDGRPNGRGGSLEDRGSSIPEEMREGLRLGTYFLRGDMNTDGNVDIADAIFGFNYLFAGLTPPRCMDAADANDDGRVNLSDSIALLNGLFADGPIQAPFPVAGIDETPDPLDCGLLLSR